MKQKAEDPSNSDWNNPGTKHKARISMALL